MKKKIKSVISMALLGVLAVTLCACGGDNNDKNSAENNSSENQSSGDTVVFGTTLGLEGLDPHSVTQAGTRAILFNVYEGLLKANSDGGVAEAVAQSYSVSDDGKTYTFVLRDGIKFSDGTDVTVDDIKYSIERYASIHSNSEDAFGIFDEVQIVDENTVNVVFTEGNNELLSAFTLAAIIPESIGDDISTNPVGTGPYKYVSNTEGESLELSANEYYWQDGVPSIPNAEFLFISDATTAYQMLQAGSIDVLPYLSADQVSTLSEGYYAEQGYMSYAFQMFMNSDYEPLSNTLVRQAICYSIDKDAINELTSDGASGAIGANIINSMTEYFNEDTANTYSYDTEKAKELLAEAGYEDGFELTIAVPNVNTLYTNTAEMIVEYLKAVGIDANMELMETEAWYSLYVNGLDDEYQAMLLAWDTADLSPGSWMALYTSDASNNFMHYSNSDYDNLYLEAKNASGTEKVTLYKELQQLLADDAAAEFLFTPADYVGLKEGLEGYTYYPATVWDLSALYYSN